MWNAGWLWSQCGGIVLHLELICGTTSYFTFLQWHQCLSRRVTVFLLTLWSSFKQIKATNAFDWEHGIALHAMQWNRASSRGEWEVSWFFSSCGWNLGYILELQRGWPFKTHVCSVMSGLCLVARDTSGFSQRLDSTIGMPLEPTQGTGASCRVDLGYMELFCVAVVT